MDHPFLTSILRDLLTEITTKSCPPQQREILHVVENKEKNIQNADKQN